MQATAAKDLDWEDSGADGFTVLEGELAAATGDGSDAPQLSGLVPVLGRLRSAFGMEMVFVGQLHDGALAARPAAPDSDCNPFEEAYGRGLLEARCKNSDFAAVAVCRDDGIEAGTLICGVVATGDVSHGPPDSLKSVSRLLASSLRRIEVARVSR